jgi:hypothetical protein
MQVNEQYKPPPKRSGSNGRKSNPKKQPWRVELSNDRREFERFKYTFAAIHAHLYEIEQRYELGTLVLQRQFAGRRRLKRFASVLEFCSNFRTLRTSSGLRINFIVQ